MKNFRTFAEQIVESSNRCIFFTDQDNRLSFVNSACRQWLDGGRFQDLLGQRIGDVDVDPLVRALVERSHAEFQRGGAAFQDVDKVELDGVEKLLAFRGTRVLEENEQTAGYAYVFSFQDAAEEFGCDKVMIRNLLRSSQDLIYFKDLDSRFTCVNEAMVERLGADSIEDVIGKSDFDFWDSESATQFYEVEQEIIRSREPTGARTESGVRANGEVMWSLMSKMPLIDDHGKVVGTFGINKDITIQKQFEEQLEATNKELIVASRRAGMAEVATNVLHNVGNVINSINVSISQADEISRRLKIDNLQKVAKMITDNASNRDYLTDDLKGQRIPEYLTLITKELKKDKEEVVAELESAKRHLEHIKNIVCMQQEYATASSVNEEIDLAEILEDAIRMSSGSLERHRIQLIREFDAGMVVFIDKHRVLQILVNLIRNAKHAMKATDRDDKQMIVSVAKDQVGMVAISVKDNGIGISPDNLTNLFNHGFTTKKGGHGFGLHSGANFARQLGGSLIAESAGLGHGATFTLTLPIVVDDSSDSSTLMPVLHADSGVFDHHSDFSV